ncbi:MAG TPA: hydroxymethylglutaryl-CoA lyase [Acidobacteriota bacterium]|nr:hydroxymethylglutaryl-CoA lyase [Acidobacteriota bacterium]
MAEVIVHEVGPRDGLQIEEQVVPTEQKIDWITALINTGIDVIQLGSFVHPDKVPQMADTDRLFSHFSRPGSKARPVVLSGLVLNEKGLERGMSCGVELFCMGISASDTHSRKNTGMNTEEACRRIIAMARKAQEMNKAVQVSVQSAFGCGYEGTVPKETVLGIVRKFLDAGLRTISLADTAGHANPGQVEDLFGAIRVMDPKVECACHFHDTYGLGLANCYAALNAGVRYFECAFAGMGGCPFTAVTGGNVCTEDLVHVLQRMNLRRDINLRLLMEIAGRIAGYFKREMPGRIYRTGPIPESSR